MPIWLVLHLGAVLTGAVLDLIIGDPVFLPHPIRWMGSLIGALEKRMNDPEDRGEKRRRKGRRLVATVILITAVCSGGATFLCYFLHPAAGFILESILSAYMLAAHSLRSESARVEKALKKGTLEDGRNAVARIVGRDTAQLSQEGVLRAAVETVAENTSDGVIAPLFWLLLGGPVFGCVYKAINTMDSMIGYKNEKYLDFGRAAAKLDDAVNYLPARMSGLLLSAAAGIRRDTKGRNAIRIMKRDAKKSTSPNAGYPEAAVAGALEIELLGDAYYGGKPVKKPTIGDAIREIEMKDISRTGALMFLAEGLFLLIPAVILMIFGICMA